MVRCYNQAFYKRVSIKHRHDNQRSEVFTEGMLFSGRLLVHHVQKPLFHSGTENMQIKSVKASEFIKL